MSAKDLPALAEMRLKIADMEKEILSYRNQIEILNNELSQKNDILEKTNSELSELQKQYKQALDKIVELSQRSKEKYLTSEEERIYRAQLSEQSVCIATLQDRLWESEKLRKETIIQGGRGHFPYNSYSHNRKNSSQCFKNHSFNDPIPNIERAERKIMNLHQKMSECSKENEYCKREMQKWDKFISNIIGLIVEAFEDISHLPSDDRSDQRRFVLEVLENIIKQQKNTGKIYSKYHDMKEKYTNAKDYLIKIEKRCDHLSEVADLKNLRKQNNKVFAASNSNNQDDSSFINQKNSYYNSLKKNTDNEYKFSKYNLDNDKKEKYYNFTKNQNISSDDDSNYQFKCKKSPNSDPINYKSSKIIDSDIININRSESDFCYDSQQNRKRFYEKNISDVTPNRSRICNKDFSKSCPKRKRNESFNESENDAFCRVGAGISRLAQVTRKMKNDYYDFAKITNEIPDSSSYSIEELSKINSSY